MKAARHPFVAAILAAIGGAVMAQAHRGNNLKALLADGKSRANSRWRAVMGANSNGSARVQRAARKARNVARNRRAHRG